MRPQIIGVPLQIYLQMENVIELGRITAGEFLDELIWGVVPDSVVNARAEKFVVVFHGCYFNEGVDNGCRVYNANDPYLDEYPSMYTLLEEFDTYAEAVSYMNEEPLFV